MKITLALSIPSHSLIPRGTTSCPSLMEDSQNTYLSILLDDVQSDKSRHRGTGKEEGEESLKPFCGAK